MLKEEFINKYKSIRDFCVKNNLIVYVHGTHRDTDNIMNNGLNAIRPELLKTSFCFGLGQESVNIEGELQKMEHFCFPGSDAESAAKGEIKKFVIFGVPAECNYEYNYEINNGARDKATLETKPLWAPVIEGEYTDSMHQGEYSFTVTLLPEFIICSINIETQEIKENQLFKTNHDYSGFIYDPSSFPYTICPKESEFDTIDDIIDFDDPGDYSR